MNETRRGGGWGVGGGVGFLPGLHGEGMGKF